MKYVIIKIYAMRIELIIVRKRIAGYRVIRENALPRVVFFQDNEGKRA